MKGFVISLTILILIAALTVTNAVFYRRTVNELINAVSEAINAEGEEKTRLTAECIRLTDEKKLWLHLTLRRSKIDALQGKLDTALAYCGQNKLDEASVHLITALKELEKWRGTERPSVWNIL